ncbi:hypothetical protein JCM10207_002197 [Rhodosporidiobolus poonsookiae]
MAWTWDDLELYIDDLRGHQISAWIAFYIPDQAAWNRLAIRDWRDIRQRRTFQAILEELIQETTDRKGELLSVPTWANNLPTGWLRYVERTNDYAEERIDLEGGVVRQASDELVQECRLRSEFDGAVDRLEVAFRAMQTRFDTPAWHANWPSFSAAFEKLLHGLRTGKKESRRGTVDRWGASGTLVIQVLRGVHVEGQPGRMYLSAVVIMLNAAAYGCANGLYLNSPSVTALANDLDKVIIHGYKESKKPRRNRALGKAHFVPLSRCRGEWLA